MPVHGVPLSRPLPRLPPTPSPSLRTSPRHLVSSHRRASQVFDRLEAKLAHAMLSLPATKGFEFGSGFGGTVLRGSVHNDPFVPADGCAPTHPSLSLSDSAGGAA